MRNLFLISFLMTSGFLNLCFAVESLENRKPLWIPEINIDASIFENYLEYKNPPLNSQAHPSNRNSMYDWLTTDFNHKQSLVKVIEKINEIFMWRFNSLFVFTEKIDEINSKPFSNFNIEGVLLSSDSGLTSQLSTTEVTNSAIEAGKTVQANKVASLPKNFSQREVKSKNSQELTSLLTNKIGLYELMILEIYDPQTQKSFYALRSDFNKTVGSFTFVCPISSAISITATINKEGNLDFPFYGGKSHIPSHFKIIGVSIVGTSSTSSL